MNANDVIESYVNDVAVQLPRRQRDDVALELRGLIDEELQARAEAAGRAVDAAMATEFLRGFGRPAEVAARYRQALTIIDPADGHNFLRAAVIGLAAIWCLGLLKRLQQPIDSAWDLLTVIGQWWGATAIPSLWWPGLLVLGFGAAAWARRRWPQNSEWKPRAGDRIHSSRAAMMMGLIGILCGLFVLVDPRWLLDALFGGRLAPAAYEAFTYSDTFRQRQAPILLVLILLNVPLLIAGIVNGRWPALMQRLQTGLSLFTCAVMTWTILDGPVFVAPASDRSMKFALAVIVAITLLGLGIKAYRSVRPSPQGGMAT